MDRSPPPFETMVFVCTHQRAPGERIACANQGRDGQAILDGLKKEVQKRGLEGKIRICKSGCMDRCEEGPNIFIAGPGAKAQWLKAASTADLPAIAQSVFKIQ